LVRLRRSGERGFEDFGWTDNWMTFSFGGYHDRDWMRFGPLRVIVENHIQPHSGFPSHSHRDVEIVTYGRGLPHAQRQLWAHRRRDCRRNAADQRRIQWHDPFRGQRA